MEHREKELENMKESLKIWRITWGSLSIFFNVYWFLRERERECVSGEGAEKETQNPKPAPSSELSAQSPRGARTHGPRDHDLSRSRTLNQLSHPGAPVVYFYQILSRDNFIVTIPTLKICHSLLFSIKVEVAVPNHYAEKRKTNKRKGQGSFARHCLFKQLVTG